MTLSNHLQAQKPPRAIRTSRPGDHDRVVVIWRAAVDATHTFLSPASRAAIDVEAEAYLRSTPLWLAVDGRDRPLGFMALGEGRLDALFVDPAHHRRGIGHALVDWAAALHPVLDTEVNAQNPGAAAFYGRIGFVETGYSPLDDQGRPYPLVRLRLDRRDGAHVRLARPADLALLPEIERSAAQAFRSTAHAWVADDGLTPDDAYPPLLAGRRLWVIEAGGDLAGFVSAAQEEDCLHVLELAVHAAHQRRGHGRRLMLAAIQAARARGLAGVTLTTFEDVPFNAPFYRSLGFRAVEAPGRRLQAILDQEAGHGLNNRCAMRLALRA